MGQFVYLAMTEVDVAKRPEPGDPIEALLGFMVDELNLDELLFCRYPPIGDRVLISVPAERIRLPGFTVARLEKEVLMPRETKYRSDISLSTTAITSLVKPLDSGWRHLLLLDLDLPPALPVQQVLMAKRVLSESPWSDGGLKVLVNSGNSLHFYGIDLLEEAKWRKWMLAARELSIVGVRYPTYRLGDGYGSLRVGTHPGRHAMKPMVAEVWE